MPPDKSTYLHFWECVTIEEAMMKYERRYHCRPERVLHAYGMIWVGPAPETQVTPQPDNWGDK